MDYKDILFLRAKSKEPYELRVSGTSMEPILHNNEVITVCRKDDYTVGDILVFSYKENNLLMHRLIKIEHGRYYCKGDNSFRLEDMEYEQIIGAVIIENDRNNNPEFISESLKINRVFRKSGYNVELTKLSLEYLEYKRKYLENEYEV